MGAERDKREVAKMLYFGEVLSSLHVGQVVLTPDISHALKSKSHGSKHVYVGRLVAPWSLVLLGYRVLWFFLPVVLFAAAFILWCAREK